MKSLSLNSQLKAELLELNDQYFASTTLPHLIQIKGWNAGKVHTVMATSGAGKSTYVRSVIVDFVRHNPDKRVLVWLSESTVKEFQTELAHVEGISFDNVFALSELDDPELSKGFNIAETPLLEHEIEFYIVDNLTTSAAYSNDYKTQNAVFRRLKEVCSWLKIPFLLIAHTRKEIDRHYPKLLNSSHMQGSSDVAKHSHFFFVLQNIYINKAIRTHLVIEKHRGRDLKEALFYFPFNKKTQLFERETAVDYDEFRQKWKMRNKLD